MRVTDDLSILRRAEPGKATVDELAEADWTLEERITAALATSDLKRART